MESTRLRDSSNQARILSVVIPAYNEEQVIEETFSRIKSILFSADIDNEIIVVNDGSTDGTLDVLRRIQNEGELRIIHIPSNSGHMNAIRAGLEASFGEYVVTIDADLQDPPEYIPDMFNLIANHSIKDESQHETRVNHEKAYDVVQAYRVDRTEDTFWKRKSAGIYYSIIRKITGISLVPHAADFRIMKRHVVERLISLPEQKLVYRLLIPSLGFRIATFPIERRKRFSGTSKYTNRKMIGLAVDSIIGFTNRPLRFLAFSGVVMSFVLFLGSISTLFLYLLGNTIPGWPSLVLLILSSNAFLFAGIGLVGEYVGRIYLLAQARPGVLWNEIQKIKLEGNNEI
jgi:glycosyltransferase involved in cell wall biosynthesis